MAAIALSDMQLVAKKVEGDYTEVVLVTPATADSDDTVDVSSLVADGQLLGLSSWVVSDGIAGNAATYAVGTGVVTIDPSGGRTNDTHAIKLSYTGKTLSV